MHPDCIIKVGQFIRDRDPWFLLEQVQSFQSIFVAKGRLSYTGRGWMNGVCANENSRSRLYMFKYSTSTNGGNLSIRYDQCHLNTNKFARQVFQFNEFCWWHGRMRGGGGLIKGGGKNRVVAIQKGNLSLLIHKPSKTQEGPFHCFDVFGSDYGLFSTYPKNKVLNTLLIATKSHLKDKTLQAMRMLSPVSSYYTYISVIEVLDWMRECLKWEFQYDDDSLIDQTWWRQELMLTSFTWYFTMVDDYIDVFNSSDLFKRNGNYFSVIYFCL